MIIRFWNTRSKPAGTHGCRLPAGMCRPTACRCRPATALRTAPSRPCSWPAKAKFFFLTLPEEWINLGNLMSARAAVIDAATVRSLQGAEIAQMLRKEFHWEQLHMDRGLDGALAELR